MLLNYNNFTIRNATTDDAVLLVSWWNDGKVMAHAGFPNGLDQTAEEIADKIKDDTYVRKILSILQTIGSSVQRNTKSAKYAD